MKIHTKFIIKYFSLTVLLVVATFVVLEKLIFPQEDYQLFHSLEIELLVGWVALSAIVFVIAYYMTCRELRLVSKIVKRVDNITASNLSERVEIENPKDEVGELAATFNDMLDRLEKSFDVQKMFVSNFSHGLRTPLAALIAELELSLRKERSGEDYIQTIENALIYARDVDKLTNDLTDLAKANYRADQIKMTSVRLDELLFDVSRVVMQAHSNYNIDLIFDEDNDDERLITVYGNEYLLGTAFINLMKNNCKFSHNHNSTVHISFLDNKVYIRFSDTGIGISPEDMKQLFKPFYRGENRHFAPGNGIGMALVERIVKLHGGTISVDSVLGEGTTFILSFEHIIFEN